jgi:cysteinyl-tRNA synthetase
MTLHLHDTLTGSRIPLPARNEGETSLYVCGPTVYNLIHVGNARPAVVFDLLTRHLRASGRRVRFVRNFTDIDDKIIKVAVERGEEPMAVAQRYIDAYLEDTGALGCRRPDVEPRVSQHLPEIVAMIEALLARGHAYVIDGDVYFAVETYPDYGKLSKRNLEDLKAGARIEVDQSKRNPLDFALWKAAKPGEPPGARWPSPWGEGRPGWHIECSAMARKWLGDGFDLHGGGIDLIFPHHENEIAQSECATGQPFARAWMHNGFVNINDEKISKSTFEKWGGRAYYFILRNVLRLADPEGVRLWLLGTHYRSPLNFEIAEEGGAQEGERSTLEPPAEAPKVRFPGIEEAEKRVEYFYETKARLLARVGRASMTPPAAAKPGSPLGEIRRRFDAALDDDLNTAEALAVVSDLFKRANELCDSNKKDTAEARAVLEAIDHVADVLGVAEGDPERFFERVRARRVAQRGIDPAEIERLLQERVAARKARDFARADAIRNELLGRGIEIRDTPAGTTWRVV